jgi:hypothetical protein
MHTYTLVTIGLVLSACTDDSVVEVGQLEVPGGGQRVAVPTSATTGEPFQVDIATWDDGCISFERTDVETSNESVEITPYDRRTLDGGCTDILLELDHGQTIVFDTAGAKTVRVVGRRVSPAGDEPMELTFTLTVN